MSEEKDFFKTCFNTVASLDVKNESQAIAKEVVLSEVEKLQQENKQLKDNWNKLRDYVLKKQAILFDTEYTCYSNVLDKMKELKGNDSNE